ncbi:MAG: isoprenylcysteine carboxylmethyltransferase family protein [Terriglobia bacterium]
MSILFRTFLFSTIALTVIMAGIPYFLHRLGILSLTVYHWTAALPGGLTCFLGALIYLICSKDFAQFGQGTPAVWNPPIRFVTRGLYRLVRNPMYLGIVLIISGEACFFQSTLLLLLAIFVWLLFHTFVYFYEEPTLRRKFGPSYQEYCARVSRWLPRWPE